MLFLFGFRFIFGGYFGKGEIDIAIGACSIFCAAAWKRVSTVFSGVSREIVEVFFRSYLVFAMSAIFDPTCFLVDQYWECFSGMFGPVVTGEA